MRTLALYVSLLLAPLALQAAEALRVGVVPWRPREVLLDLYAPTVRLLERSLARPVEFFVAGDFDEVRRRMEARSVDIAFFGPTSYVKARRELPGIRYLATCMLPEDHFYSLVVVRKDAKLSALADAKGRAIGLTDKQSTSGYVVPRLMFSRAGVDVDRDARVYLLGRHAGVFEALAKGAVEAGGVASTDWDAAVRAHGDIFRVLARSFPIPLDPVAAAPHLDPKLAARIQGILAGAAKDPQFLRERGELRGFTVRSDKFYDPIREISR